MLRAKVFLAAALGWAAVAGQSSAALRFTNAVTAQVGDSGEALAFADMNRDGRLDVLAGTQIFLQQPDGSLTNRFGFAGSFFGPFVVADFTGDGSPDVMRTGQVSTNRGDGSVVLCSTLPGVGTGSADRGKAGDFNGDGRLDLVTYTGNDRVLRVWLGDGAGRFNAVGQSNQFDRYWCDIDIADFNRDGVLDVTLFRGEASDSNTVVMLMGQGNGLFTAPVSYPRGYSYDRARIRAGDLNMDSFPDVAAAGYYVQFVTAFLGQEGGRLMPPLNSGRGGILHFELADLNGDELLDEILIANNALQVSLGRGDGTFTNQPPIPLNVIGFPTWSAFAVGDYNRDLKPDILVAHSQSSTYYVTILTNCSIAPQVRPSLRLLSVGPEVLAWPRLSNGFFFPEFTAHIRATNQWQRVTNPVVRVGDSFLATNRALTPKAFYRLNRN